MAGKRFTTPRRLRSMAAALLLAVAPVVCGLYAHATGVNQRSVQLSTSTPGAAATYTTSFTISTTNTVGSVVLEFCSNSPIEEDACVAPDGFDASSASLAGESGITDFTLTSPAANKLLFSRTASVISAPLPVSLHVSGITNPAADGSYYAKLSMYSSTDGTGSSNAFGGFAFAITEGIRVNSYVPPYLTMCTGVTIAAFDCSSASGDYINFGNISSAHSSQATSQILVASNAGNGYGIQVAGATLTSGNNVIPPLANPAFSLPGTSQFGINLRANTLPAVGADPTGAGVGQPTTGYNQPDHFKFVSDDVVAAASQGDDYRRYTVSYLVNISAAQPVGIYGTTLTYVGVASF